MGLTLLLYFPGFHALTAAANPALERAARASAVIVKADPTTCRLQFDLLGRSAPRSACDVLRTTLADSGVPYQLVRITTDGWAQVDIAGLPVVRGSFNALDELKRGAEAQRLTQSLKSALQAAGYPARAARDAMNLPALLGILLAFMLASTALYGPQAAALVELFPDLDPLHRTVGALQHRHRLDRRTAAGVGLRAGRGDRRYLLRSVLSGSLHGHQLHLLLALVSGDLGPIAGS